MHVDGNFEAIQSDFNCRKSFNHQFSQLARICKTISRILLKVQEHGLHHRMNSAQNIIQNYSRRLASFMRLSRQYDWIALALASYHFLWACPQFILVLTHSFGAAKKRFASTLPSLSENISTPCPLKWSRRANRPSSRTSRETRESSLDREG